MLAVGPNGSKPTAVSLASVTGLGVEYPSLASTATRRALRQVSDRVASKTRGGPPPSVSAITCVPVGTITVGAGNDASTGNVTSACAG